MTTAARLECDSSTGIATVTVDGVERLNALSAATLAELGSVVESILRDETVRGAIVTGAGTRAFAAGADIQELATLGPREATELSRAGQAVFRSIETAPKPFVAAVNGFALGGGCELALACHLRIASTTASFGFPEVKLGIIPGYGGTARLARLVGQGRALELILSGDAISAAEAHRIGIVNRIAEGDDVVGTARELLARILANGPLAIAGAIEAVVRGSGMGLDDALRFESRIFGLLASTEDMREGMNAFLAKRPPAFRGR